MIELISGSKTFLVGEYTVLFGGSAVVLVSAPYFKLSVKKDRRWISGISKGSPAGKFYNHHKDIFSNLSLEFFDPHHHAGGWGASSAQYALIYRLFLRLCGGDFILKSFLDDYRMLAGDNRIPPSGADCLAQYFNQNIFYDSTNSEVSFINWSFPNLDFIVVKTNLKVFTYKHLMNLGNLETSRLQHFVNNVKSGIDTIDENLFLENLQNFFYELENNSLVIPQTSHLVRQILKLSHVKAAKGCGAMSADTILVVCEKGFKEEVSNSVKKIIHSQ